MGDFSYLLLSVVMALLSLYLIKNDKYGNLHSELRPIRMFYYGLSIVICIIAAITSILGLIA